MTTKISEGLRFPGEGVAMSSTPLSDWYTGTLRVPKGRELNDVHMAFGSTFERDLLLEVRDGVVVGGRVQSNAAADRTQTTQWYREGVFTVFGRGEETGN
ncbi:hypothetical protein ACPWT1_02845 [Ramlibacter sp. MMS24-I3-19]|uniref:hypothetical protein n=1 Tax=Ramlibacter sp. MMS24-I3-19 TaxID=3416606 RepID=UPI003D087422